MWASLASFLHPSAKRMASYIGQQFTIAKTAENICRSIPSSLPCVKTWAMPQRKEMQLIMAAVVIGNSKGDETPNSNSPWPYRLLCSSSTVLFVTLNPNVEMPMVFSKYSANPNNILVSPLIIHTLWSFHHLWIDPPDNINSRQCCPYIGSKEKKYTQEKPRAWSLNVRPYNCSWVSIISIYHYL